MHHNAVEENTRFSLILYGQQIFDQKEGFDSYLYPAIGEFVILNFEN
jgi:hypothetical protein